MAVAGWGMYKMYAAQANRRIENEKADQDFLTELNARLSDVRASLVTMLEEWFDREVTEQNRRIEQFLRDAYCVFVDDEPGTTEELTVAIKQRERQISEIQTELKKIA